MPYQRPAAASANGGIGNVGNGGGSNGGGMRTGNGGKQQGCAPVMGNGYADDYLLYDTDDPASKSSKSGRSRRSSPYKKMWSPKERRSKTTTAALSFAALILFLILLTDETERMERREVRKRRRRAEAVHRIRNEQLGVPQPASGGAGGGGGDERLPGWDRKDKLGKLEETRRWRWRQRNAAAVTAAAAAIKNIGPGKSPSGRYRWTDPRQLPQLPGEDNAANDMIEMTLDIRRRRRDKKDFTVRREGLEKMDWEKSKDEGAVDDDDGARRTVAKADEELTKGGKASGAESDGGGGRGAGDYPGGRPNHARGHTGGSSPRVDYTSTVAYSYPDLMSSPPTEGGYPSLETLGTIMRRWPQDDVDHPPQPLVERLQHFDYNDPVQREMALKFREAELPFKVYNVPEVVEAGKRWSDEYVGKHYGKRGGVRQRKQWFDLLGSTKKEEDESNGAGDAESTMPKSHGQCQESTFNFFSFFQPLLWNVETMGKPPTLDNDWTYEHWAKHARYADRVGLEPHEPHYYWQAGIPREERLQSEDAWTFVSRDLPSFSNPEPTFFGFNPPAQKGIQCRFGERGVTAATHYDAGRNMVAMMVGAKRYVLAPPNQCPKLGIVTRKRHPVFRHSLLNFGYLNLLNADDPDAQSMPEEERAWLEVADESLAVETVLKAGEVLYIPSHWFHYITSLQKSAQCNTRSGREREGTAEFGGFDDVIQCVGEDGA